MQQPTVDVAIVGFGPAGQALASLLGSRGHRVVVLEKFADPYGLPRMSTLDGEIARLLQHTGDPTVALAKAIPQPEVEMFGTDGQLVGALDWRYERGGHPSHLSVNQPDIEDAMLQRIAGYRNVDLRWGHEVTGLEQLPAGVRVTFRQGQDGSASSGDLTARYVVGMDGASSFVRKSLGIGVEVLHEHEELWVLTDFEATGELPTGLGHRIYADMTPQAQYFYGPNGAGRCRTDVRLAPDTPATVVDDHEAAFAFMEQRVGVSRELLRITRRILYRFRSQVALELRRGDVFIGGDAAHAMPPYLGQGACTAMRDSANLAWKLDLVLSGRAAPELLDSYEAERLEQNAQYVEGSLAVWRLVNIQDIDEARARDAYVAENGAMGFEADPLLDGIVHRLDGRTPGPHAGALAPQGTVAHGGGSALLDDVVGYGFQLITTAPVAEALGSERIRRLGELGVLRLVLSGDDEGARTIDDVDGEYARWFRGHDATALLARPDFYLFGTAHGELQTVELVDDLLAQLAVQPLHIAAA